MGKQTLKAEYDVIVAGAGLGGLTAAALLSREGFSTLVIEKLPHIGGRFTNIPYKGFQLTTGALHLIPHQRGVVNRLLRGELKTDLEFIDMGPTPIMFNGSIIERILGLPAELDSVFRFSIGLKFQETPLLERIRFMIKSVTAGGPCMPKGGCESIIRALEKIVLDKKGEIFKRASVKKIIIQKSSVAGIKIERYDGLASTVSTSLLISDIGPRNTLRMLPESSIKDDFKRKVDKIKATEGIKISIESNKPILNEIIGEDTGLVLTPLCDRIAGIAEPSSLDPNLAPPGKSLLMTAQKISSPNIENEIKIGIKDLENIIPDFNKNCRVLATQVFKGEWPVNHARQGLDAPQITPINGLYLVGDGAKPSGFIMAEGVVESARRVADHIKRT